MVDTIDPDTATLIDYKVNQFLTKNNYCLALNKDNTRCKHLIGHYNSENILCKLHRNKKTKAKYIIVYIDNENTNENGNDNGNDNDNNNDKLINNLFFKRYGYNDHSHIIAYPYKNTETYFRDIELYKKELKEIAIENYVKLKEIKTCKVCSEDYSHDDLIQCSKITCDNKHAVCSTCIKC